jgi:hypothetical protein
VGAAGFRFLSTPLHLLDAQGGCRCCYRYFIYPDLPFGVLSKVYSIHLSGEIPPCFVSLACLSPWVDGPCMVGEEGKEGSQTTQPTN